MKIFFALALVIFVNWSVVLGAEYMALLQHWTKGEASDCSNLGCSTVGSLTECLDNCSNDPDCNLANFCPDGGDCTSGLNRCCLRKCTDDDHKLSTEWKGWNIYIKAVGSWTMTEEGKWCRDTIAEDFKDGLAVCQAYCEENGAKTLSFNTVPNTNYGTNYCRCCTESSELADASCYEHSCNQMYKLLDEYMHLEETYCTGDFIPNENPTVISPVTGTEVPTYSTLDEAMDACSENTECGCIYHVGCEPIVGDDATYAAYRLSKGDAIASSNPSCTGCTPSCAWIKG